MKLSYLKTGRINYNMKIWYTSCSDEEGDTDTKFFDSEVVAFIYKEALQLLGYGVVCKKVNSIEVYSESLITMKDITNKEILIRDLLTEKDFIPHTEENLIEIDKLIKQLE